MQTTMVKPVTMRRSTRARRGNVMQSRLANIAISQTQRTFLAWFPNPTAESGLAEVIHALYYLPQNFMLILPRPTAQGTQMSKIITDSPFVNRIQFSSTEGSLHDEPSLLADAIIRNEHNDELEVMPAQFANSSHTGDFVVAPSAEAVASALLTISRSN